MVNKFTQKAASALSSALTLAQELGHSYIGTEHLLLGLVSQNDSIASRILVLRGASECKIRQSITDYMGIGSKSDICSDDMTPRLRMIIEDAAEESQRAGVRYVGTEHLLIALLNRKDCVAVRLLEGAGICISEIKSDISAYIGSAPYRAKESQRAAEEDSKKSKRSPLLTYGKDLTELARLGRTDPVLCRDEETERMIRILCRRGKNNPCLIGEPGVGKTAVVEGLAQRICAGNVPDELKSKRIITLDISSMIAGAKYRGEFEDRIKNVIDEVQKRPDVILFVDEMHVMVGAGGAEGAIDASNILKPSLARGEIRMIGATTPSEYRTHIEKDPAFERRFQPVTISEPTEDECREILFGLREGYQAHHKIKISDEAINEAVRLSVRYINDRFLPDKAIDLLDEACARLRLSAVHESSPQAVLEAKKEEAIRQGNFAYAAKLSDEERKLRATSSECSEYADRRPTLSANDVAEIISEQTNIPCQALLLTESQRLVDLESELKKSIIGQDDAIRVVSDAIRRGRVGLCDPKRPIGSFLFLGASGVGKTELCRALASTVYQRKDALIRFDMSEYMEKHSVSKLIGSPPGYVGHENGGLLTERVRRSPHSLLLFDEIEKAHPDVLGILLQILEDGRLTDALGRVVSFSSTVIIMTSNLVSSSDVTERTIGFSPSGQNSKEQIRQSKKLLEFFRPEFINRIDDIVLFSSLTERDLCKITQIMLDDLVLRAREAGIKITVSPEVASAIVGKCAATSKNSGARHLRRQISESIEFELSKHVLNQSGKEWIISAKDDDIIFAKVTDRLPVNQ